MSKQLAISFLAGLAITGCIAGIACIPGADSASFLLLPGVFAAAVLFPQGIHGNYPIAFMILSGIFDVALYGCLALRLVRRQLSKKSHLNQITKPARS